MKRTILFIHIALFAFSGKDASAQSDTILIGYSQNDISSSLINEMIILPDHKIGFTQSTISGYKAFVTDTKGEVIYQRKLDYVDGYTISSSSFMFDDVSRYVYIGNAIRNGKRFFIAYSLDTTLQDIRLLDTVQVENDVAVFTNMMKYNPHKSMWEGFGYGRWVSVAGTAYICYIGLDEHYEFKKFERLHGEYQKDIVLEFQWIEAIGRYFIKPFGDRSLLVDEGFNVINEDVGITLVYAFNSATHITSLGMYNCLEPVGSTMLCYSKEPFDWPYNTSISKLDLQGDSIHLIEAIPLSDPPLGMNYGSQMRVDLDGNYVISGVNAFDPPTPNTVRVAKFSQTYQKLWEFSYLDDKAFAIWDMEIDQNNDIVLVGQSWNIFADGQARGFLMKVYSNGKLTSYYEIPEDSSDPYKVQINPNPATSTLCLHASIKPRAVRLWDLSGRLIADEKTGLPGAEGSYCIDLPPALAPGFYTAEICFPDGKRVIRKVVAGQ